MLELTVVGLVVAAALAYAVWALTPATTRLRMARKLAAWGEEQDRPTWIARATAAVERAAGRRQGDCTGCSPPRPEDPKPRQ